MHVTGRVERSSEGEAITLGSEERTPITGDRTGTMVKEAANSVSIPPRRQHRAVASQARRVCEDRLPERQAAAGSSFEAADARECLRARIVEIRGAVGADDEHIAVLHAVRSSEERRRVTGARLAHVADGRGEGAVGGVI